MSKLIKISAFILLISAVLSSCSLIDPNTVQLAPGGSYTFEETYQLTMSPSEDRYYTPDFSWISAIQNGAEITGPEGLRLTNKSLDIRVGVLTDIDFSSISASQGVIINARVTATVPDGASVSSGDIIISLPGLTSLGQFLGATPVMFNNEDMFIPPDSLKIAYVNVSGSGFIRLILQAIQLVIMGIGVLILLAIVSFLGDSPRQGKRFLRYAAILALVTIAILLLPVAIPLLIGWRIFKPEGFKAFFSSSDDKNGDTEQGATEATANSTATPTPAQQGTNNRRTKPQPVATSAPATSQATAVKPKPQNKPQTVKTDYQVQLQQAYQLLKENKVNEGTKLVRSVLTEDPENTKALILMGHIMRGKKKPDLARTYYQKAVDLGSKQAQKFIAKL